MVVRTKFECISCNKHFFFRYSPSRNNLFKFRLNCPNCNLEMHGECFLNYKETDGTINLHDLREKIRISGAKQLDYNTIEKDCFAVTVYADIPILKSEYLTKGNELGIAMPAMQIVRCLGNNKAKEFLTMIDITLDIPEDDFWFIREAFNQYKLNNLDKAKEILDKITNEQIIKLSRIPSTCAKLYQIYFLGLVGQWPGLYQHIKMIENLSNNPVVFFHAIKTFSDINFIEHYLEKMFDLSEELFNARILITVSKYLEYSTIGINEYQLTHDYPDQFYHLYEQLCEFNHFLIKIIIGYLNAQNRGSIDNFYNNKYKNYDHYFNNAKLFNSLDLIKEHNYFGSFFNTNIERNIRNGIAHKMIKFSIDGQKIIIKNKGKESEYMYVEILIKMIHLSQSGLAGFTVFTDIKRLVSDKLWET
ncbi:MAG: hypothetical protein LBV17_00080 [Treponema sp.]|nr:hypothetical protein [Treponema sp.]